MRLIDADVAVKKVQEQIEEIQKKKRKVEEVPTKTKYERERKKCALDAMNVELAAKCDTLVFLVYDCEEIKIATKEKE